jgi:hypothetical protein
MTSTIGIVLVIVFFVTSSDSGSLVIDTITAGGKVDAPVPAACVLVHVRGSGCDRDCFWAAGLGALQAMACSSGCARPRRRTTPELQHGKTWRPAPPTGDAGRLICRRPLQRLAKFAVSRITRLVLERFFRSGAERKIFAAWR